MKTTTTTKLKLWAALGILLLTHFQMNAQVTIGSDNEPLKGALLDLKSQQPDNNNVTSDKGGLVLARVQLQSLTSLRPFVSDAQLGTEGKKHAGLIVYNLTKTTPFEEGLYLWDGTKWVMYKTANQLANITANNGLTKTGDNIQLGGGLTKPTTITNGSNDLILNTTGAGKLQITDGNQALGKVLTSNASGQASWQSLPLIPSPTVTTANNGLTMNGTTVQLGGLLTKSTTVSQGDYNMNFTMGKGKFYVDSSTFSVDGDSRYVGIGTTNPLQKLHIVGNSYTTGNVGIGVYDANYKLNISGKTRIYNGDFVYTKGSNLTGKVLMAMDNIGTAAWQSPGAMVNAPSGSFTSTGISLSSAANASITWPNSIDTGARLSLPPGKWFVMVALLALPASINIVPTSADIPFSHVWIRTQFKPVSSANNGYIQYDGTALVSGQVSPYGFNLISGFLIIKNTHSSNVELSLQASVQDYNSPARMWPIIIARSGNVENSIAAFMLTD